MVPGLIQSLFDQSVIFAALVVAYGADGLVLVVLVSSHIIFSVPPCIVSFDASTFLNCGSCLQYFACLEAPPARDNALQFNAFDNYSSVVY